MIIKADGNVAFDVERAGKRDMKCFSWTMKTELSGHGIEGKEDYKLSKFGCEGLASDLITRGNKALFICDRENNSGRAILCLLSLYVSCENQ